MQVSSTLQATLFGVALCVSGCAELGGTPLPESELEDTGETDVVVPTSTPVFVATYDTVNGYSLTRLVVDLDGSVRDTQQRLRVPGNIRGMDFRGDSAEAVVAYGLGPKSNRGAAIFSMSEDAVALRQDVRLAGDNSPNAVMYTSDDEVLFGNLGPSNSSLVSVTHTSGLWRLGPEVPTTGNAVRLYDVGEDGHAAVLRAPSLSGDGKEDFAPVARAADGSWHPEAIPTDLTKYDPFMLGFAISPNGRAAYIRVDAAGSDAGIVTLRSNPSTRAWGVDPYMFVSPGSDGGRLEMSRDGQMMVALDDFYDADNALGYELRTFEVSEDGDLVPLPGRSQLPRVFDVLITPDDTLVATLRDGDQFVARSYRRPSEDSGEWVPVSEVVLASRPLSLNSLFSP